MPQKEDVEKTNEPLASPMLKDLLCRLADDFGTIANQWGQKSSKQKDEYFKGQYEGMAMAFMACAERIRQEEGKLRRKPA